MIQSSTATDIHMNGKVIRMEWVLCQSIVTIQRNTSGTSKSGRVKNGNRIISLRNRFELDSSFPRRNGWRCKFSMTNRNRPCYQHFIHFKIEFEHEHTAQSIRSMCVLMCVCGSRQAFPHFYEFTRWILHSDRRSMPFAGQIEWLSECEQGAYNGSMACTVCSCAPLGEEYCWNWNKFTCRVVHAVPLRRTEHVADERLSNRCLTAFANLLRFAFHNWLFFRAIFDMVEPSDRQVDVSKL